MILSHYFVSQKSWTCNLIDAMNTWAGVQLDSESKRENKLPVLESATAIAVSFAICKVAAYITNKLGTQGGILPCVTAIVVAMAILFPSQIGALAPAGEAMALILMQVKIPLVTDLFSAHVHARAHTQSSERRTYADAAHSYCTSTYTHNRAYMRKHWCAHTMNCKSGKHNVYIGIAKWF